MNTNVPATEAAGKSKAVPVLHPDNRRKRSTLAAVLVATFGLLLVTGVLLRVGTLRPNNLLGGATYNQIFSAHNIFTLAALPVALLCFTPGTKPDAGLRAVVATLLLIGAAVVGLGKGGLLLMLGGAALFVWYFVRPHLRSPVGIVLLFATITTACGWVGVLIGQVATMGMALVPVVLVALVLPMLALHTAGKAAGGAGFLVAVGTYGVCWAMARFSVAAAPLVIPELVAGLVVGIAVFRAARFEAIPWCVWARRVEAILFLEGLLLVVLMQVIGDEVLLSDTLFAVGAAHFQGFVLIFALLRQLHHAATRLGRVGLLLAVLGSQLFGWGCTALGARGMPRRYAAYLETFTSLQILTSLGAFLLFAGILLVTVAHLLSRGVDESIRTSGAPVGCP
jgi:hypothetical protein